MPIRLTPKRGVCRVVVESEAHMATAKWVKELVKKVAGSVGVNEHRVVFLVGGPGSSSVEVGNSYADRKVACRVADMAQGRSNFTKIGYVVERYSNGKGAVWISQNTLLWEGRMPEVA